MLDSWSVDKLKCPYFTWKCLLYAHLRTTKKKFQLNLIIWNLIAMKSLKKSLTALEKLDGLKWTRAHFAICFWDEYLAFKTYRRPLLQNIYLYHSMWLLVTHIHDLQCLTRNQVSVIKTKNTFQMCQNAEKGSGESLAYSIVCKENWGRDFVVSLSPLISQFDSDIDATIFYVCI